MIFWRSLLSVGDEVMTRFWNVVTRRWIAAHPPPPPPDPLEAEIRASVDNDPGLVGARLLRARRQRRDDARLQRASPGPIVSSA